MAEQVEATVSLVNQKVQFTGMAGANVPVTMDYKPPLGDGQGYTGLQLLLVSLAGCSGTALAFLLRKMGKNVLGLQVNARGTRREAPPFSFEKISLEFILTSKDASDGDVHKAIQMSEESYCPVWAMIKGNAEVTADYRLVASGRQ
jgi:putative redox protein